MGRFGIGGNAYADFFLYKKNSEKFPRKNVYTYRRGTVPCPPTGAYPHPFFVIPAKAGISMFFLKAKSYELQLLCLYSHE